jgi:pimeloyl-ACP methyl ester carboxylesterase
MIDRRLFLGSAAGAGAAGLAPATVAAKGLSPRRKAGDLRMWRAEIGCLHDGPNLYGATTRMADVGLLGVPRDHFAKAPAPGQDYQLRFARLLGPQGGKAPPVFFFNGGPNNIEDLWWLYEGGHGTRNTFSVIDTILRHTDLVLIDHRGTAGCSYPKIPNNNLAAHLPFDRPVDAAERRAECERLWPRILEHQHNAGVDLSTITTAQLTEDVDLVRQVLGYDKVRLMGLSNGTYRSRDYLRRFQPHVDSALLFVSHAYEKRPHPNDVRASVERFDAAAAADPVVGRFVPSVLDLLVDLTRRLDKTPQRVPIKGGPDDAIVVSGTDLALYFWAFFTNNSEILKFPGRLWKIKQGDYSELGAVARLGRTLGQENNSSLAYSGTAMPSAAQNQRHRDAAGEAYFLNRDIAELLGDTCPFPRDEKREFDLKVPVTYVQGEWDTHTPPEAVKRLGGAQSQVIVNLHQGHQSSITSDERQLPPCFEQAYVEAFLTGGAQKPFAHPLTFDRAAFTA